MRKKNVRTTNQQQWQWLQQQQNDRIKYRKCSNSMARRHILKIHWFVCLLRSLNSVRKFFLFFCVFYSVSLFSYLAIVVACKCHILKDRRVNHKKNWMNSTKNRNQFAAYVVCCQAFMSHLLRSEWWIFRLILFDRRWSQKWRKIAHQKIVQFQAKTK